MQTLQSFLEQSLLIWKDSTPAARIGIMLLFLMCVGAMVGVGIWSVQPDYVVLVDNVPADQITSVIDELRKANIDYDQQGSAILVDKPDRMPALTAINKLGQIGSPNNFVPAPSDILTDPVSRREWQRYNLENQIAAQLRRMKSIEDASVVLSTPVEGPFVRNRPIPKASVTLTLAPNSNFNESSASSIASSVANSVPGLTSQNVTIMDQSGFEYKTDDTFRNHSMQEKYRMNEELFLSTKAEEMLARNLGFGNAIVRVNTSFIYHDAFVKTSKFDLENKYKTVEEITTNDSKGGKGLASGAAGAASNLGDANLASRSESLDSKQETIRTENAVPKTEREEHIRTPELSAMTVAVLINSKVLVDANNQVPADLKQQYEALVKTAIGFNEERGDSISLEFLPFIDPLPLDEPAAPFPWAQVHEILKNVSLGLAGLVVLLLGVMSFRKMTLIEAVTEPRATSRESQLKELSELVKQNPKIFSEIIAAWSTSSVDADKSKTSETAASRQAA